MFSSIYIVKIPQHFMKKEKFPYHLFDSPEVDSTLIAILIFCFMLVLVIIIPVVVTIIVSVITAIISYFISLPFTRKRKRKYTFWPTGSAG